MAFPPSKKPSDLVVELGIGKKRGGPPPMWADKPKPYGDASSELSVAPAGGECAACCKQMADCKFYESNVAQQDEKGAEPMGEPMDMGGAEA